MTHATEEKHTNGKSDGVAVKTGSKSRGGRTAADGCVTPDKTCRNSDGGAGGWTLLCGSAIGFTFSPSHPSLQPDNWPTQECRQTTTGNWVGK